MSFSLATMNECVRRLSMLLYENWLSNGIDDSLAKHRALEAALKCATINPGVPLSCKAEF